MRKAELVLCKARREKSYLKVGAPAPRQEPQLLVGVGTGAKGVAALGCSRQHRPQVGGEVAAGKKWLDVAAKRKKLDVAPKQKELDVAPNRGSLMLRRTRLEVWFGMCQPEEKERELGIAPVLGRCVLGQDLDLE